MRTRHATALAKGDLRNADLIARDIALIDAQLTTTAPDTRIASGTVSGAVTVPPVGGVASGSDSGVALGKRSHSDAAVGGDRGKGKKARSTPRADGDTRDDETPTTTASGKAPRRKRLLREGPIQISVSPDGRIEIGEKVRITVGNNLAGRQMRATLSADNVVTVVDVATEQVVGRVRLQTGKLSYKIEREGPQEVTVTKKGTLSIPVHDKTHSISLGKEMAGRRLRVRVLSGVVQVFALDDTDCARPLHTFDTRAGRPATADAPGAEVRPTPPPAAPRGNVVTTIEN